MREDQQLRVQSRACGLGSSWKLLFVLEVTVLQMLRVGWPCVLTQRSTAIVPRMPIVILDETVVLERLCRGLAPRRCRTVARAPAGSYPSRLGVKGHN